MVLNAIKRQAFLLQYRFLLKEILFVGFVIYSDCSHGFAVIDLENKALDFTDPIRLCQELKKKVIDPVDDELNIAFLRADP